MKGHISTPVLIQCNPLVVLNCIKKSNKMEPAEKVDWIRILS